MKIGVYGSSFDPITNVHLWTANTVANRKKLDKVILLPASSKRIDKAMQTEDKHRYNMLLLATKDSPLNERGEILFEVERYEMDVIPGKQYTYFTMQYLQSKYPNDELFFVMGADLLKDLSGWKYGEQLVKTTKFIVMARNGIDMVQVIGRDPLLRNYDDGRFHLMDKGLSMEISSTYIREEFAMGGDPRYLLPESCYQYIIENRLYQQEVR